MTVNQQSEETERLLLLGLKAFNEYRIKSLWNVSLQDLHPKTKSIKIKKSHKLWTETSYQETKTIDLTFPCALKLLLCFLPSFSFLFSPNYIF